MEAKRSHELFEICRNNKQSIEEALNPSLLHLNDKSMLEKDQKLRMDAIENKVLKQLGAQSAFENGVYFKHLKMYNPTLINDKKLMHTAKINGQMSI